MGLGAAAPLFAAVTRRYVDAHFGPRDHSRFVALMGDAELDEGNVWEAVADRPRPAWGTCCGSSTSTGSRWTGWCPARIRQREELFASAGWHVCRLAYGRRLRGAVRAAER